MADLQAVRLNGQSEKRSLSSIAFHHFSIVCTVTSHAVGAGIGKK